MEVESILQFYHNNEREMEELAFATGHGIDYIVDNKDKFPEEVIDKLRTLLLRKRKLLKILRSNQKKELADSPVVDLLEYSQAILMERSDQWYRLAYKRASIQIKF